jgi:hypothetical protein
MKHSVKQVMNVIKIGKGVNIPSDILIIVDGDLKLHSFPASTAIPRNLSFILHDKDSRTVSGYTGSNNVFIKTWNIQLTAQEEVIDIDTAYHSADQPQLAIYDDKKVIFKHIDFTNLAMITKITDASSVNSLNLYIINGKTGRVLFNSYQLDVEFDLPITLAYDENSVIVSYFNQVNLIYEFWVVESFSN